VTSVKNGDQLIYKFSGVQESAFDREVMAKATYALQKVVEEGSGAPAQELLGPDGTSRPVAGKTGSTNDNKSAWFAGYVPQLATVVGVYQSTPDGAGQDSITPFGEWAGGSLTGGTWPVWAWTEYMKTVTEGMEVKKFPDYVPPAPSPSPSPTPSPSPSEKNDKVMVPTGLVGGQITTAMATLAGVGLRTDLVEVESEQPPGTVLSVQNEGQEVKRGSSIRIEVSKGPGEETATVPGGLVGGDENNARREIQRAGLEPVIQYQPSDDVAQGIVMDVNPDEGASVPANSQVQVIVSAGPGVFPTGDPTATPTGNGNGNGSGSP
jgi:membrane peptidoglycan carboxypeptidase